MRGRQVAGPTAEGRRRGEQVVVGYECRGTQVTRKEGVAEGVAGGVLADVVAIG